MHIRICLWLAVLPFCLTGCGRPSVGDAPPAPEKSIATPPSAPESPRSLFDFSDVTSESGVEWVYQNGREAGVDSILESLGGGVAVIDADLDGRLDLFFPGGGRFHERSTPGLPSALFHNRGGLRFGDVSAAAAVDPEGFAAPHYSHGAFVADYNNDGFPDLMVTGYGGVQLWRNQGDGTFREVHRQAGLEDDQWSTAVGWADLDGDGNLDLYLTHYVDWSFDHHPFCEGPAPGTRDICPPKVFDGIPDRLFLSNGEGTFREATREAGLRADATAKGLGVVLGDVDLDGDVDIYVANDTTENHLYRNDGAGRFEEVGALSGVAVDQQGTPNGSMGVDIGDYNLDGLPDLWAANFEVESFALYRNDGNAQFLHVSRATGVTALNGLFVGFGTLFLDLDRDGDEDIVVSNGHVIKYPRNAPLLQRPLLLVNDQGRHFRRLDAKEDSYFSQPHAGRGLAAGDLDEDGDLDLVFANNHEPAAILRNDSRVAAARWVRARLVGRRSNRDAVGSVAVLETSHGNQLRMIKGGTSYLSHSDQRLDWGFAEGVEVQRLRVRWPSGREQVIEPVPRGEVLTLLEPRGG